MKGYPYPPQILCGSMPQDVIQRITLALKTFHDGPAILRIDIQDMSLYCFYFEDAAICTGHDLFIDPIAHPATDITVGRPVGGQCYTGQDAPDVLVMGKVQMSEYVSNAPFSGTGPAK